MSLGLNPGRSVSMRNPRTLSAPPSPAPSSFAHTTATSAIDPEVIHIFSPFKMYSSPDLRARVGQPEATQFLARGQGRKPRVLLFLRPEGQDGIHHQRRLHADKAAQTRV